MILHLFQKKFSKAIGIYLSLLFPLIGIGQDGPGGVGNTDGSGNLSLWLDASQITGKSDGDDISVWADRSGKNNIVQIGSAPNYSALGGGNDQPSVHFDKNSSEYLFIAPNDTIMPSDEFSVFVAGRFDSSSDPWACFVNTSNDDDWNDGWGIGQDDSTGDMLFYIDDYRGFGHYCTKVINDGINDIYGMTYNTTSDQGDGYRSESNCSFNSFTGTLNYTVGVNDDFLIGAGPDNSGPAYFLNGDIEEIISFDVAINNAQRVIISNYLAAKYNIPLSNYDLYDEDEVAAGNYDFDVAGIGRIDASDLHNESKGTGVLTIASSAGLTLDNAFLFWGHENSSFTFNTIDVPLGINKRLERVWSASEVDTSGITSDVGDIDITFDLSSLASIDAAQLRLLVDGDGTFINASIIENAIDLGGNKFKFVNISSISDNTFFTLAAYPDEIWGNGIDDNGDGRIDEALPGGVRSNLALWLKADSGFSATTWLDQGPLGNDGTVFGDPALVSNSLNFNPGINFDGDDHVEVSLPELSFDAGTHHAAIFVVYKPSTSSTLIGVCGNLAVGDNNIGVYNGNIGNGGPGPNEPAPQLFGISPHLTSYIIDEEDNVTGVANSSKIYRNGSLISSFIFNENDSSQVNDLFHIGKSGTNAASLYFQGEIHEIIIFYENDGLNFALTPSEREQIESYLGLKYGISLSHDFSDSQ